MGEIYFYSADVTINHNYIQNFNFNIFNSSDGISMFNASGEVLSDFEKIVVAFVIKSKSNENFAEYDKMLLRGTIDTCKASEGIFGNFLMRFLKSTVKDYSNISLTCPHYKGFYYGCNFSRPDDESIPMFLPRTKNFWEASFKGKVKVPKVARLVQFFTAKVQGIAGM